MSAADPELSVEVVFLPAGGADPDAPVTAATLATHAPDRGCVDAAAAHLRRSGFAVGPLIGISLTATAPRSVVERTFGTPLAIEQAPDGSVRRASSRAGGLELPVDTLPSVAREGVRAVTFSAPPAFGPGADR